MAEAVVVMEDKFQELDLAGGAGGAPRRERRFSTDDIGCHYTSLTQVQFTSPLEPSHGLVAIPDHRRKSVASVQTEGRHHHSSSRNAVQRRRSELPDRERRRRSRADTEAIMALDPSFLKDGMEDGSMNGIRRGTRNSQMMLSNYDLESARLSVSSNRHRKTSRVSETQDPEDPDERQRSRVVYVCASIAVGIFLTAILLVAITLKMSPAIDEMVRKENEGILRELQAVSTGSHGLNTTVQPTDSPEHPQT